MTDRSAKSSRTQWTAQFLVAAELTRRNYTVALTMGHHTPMADLMVGHLPSGVQFWVNVKGLSAPGGTWLVEKPGKPTLNGLYYVLVLVGEEREKDRFFILSQPEARDLIEKYGKSRWDVNPAARPLDPGGFQGFRFGDPAKFEECWNKLPPNGPL